jgi:DtxR family Mn-dependent transcriptional regulator
MPSHAVEDYLKVIYDLTLDQERAGTSQIAEVMDVKPASVSGMIRKMAQASPPLLDYQKHHGVSLTLEGYQTALEVIRHHRLLETYLHDHMGYSWEEVHEEAERLEHVISERFEEAIADLLGDPTHDPHGAPIPTQDLEMPPQRTLSLNALRPGQSGIIRQVLDRDPDLLSYLSDRGVVPDVRFVVLAYSPFDQNLTLQIQGEEGTVVLGETITQQIFVERE